jgi:hypothetical protein
LAEGGLLGLGPTAPSLIFFVVTAPLWSFFAVTAPFLIWSVPIFDAAQALPPASTAKTAIVDITFEYVRCGRIRRIELPSRP